ncbi:MAG: hypothetical protein Q7U48_13985 [Hydrogenophaga sp.]|nr:hypothetical protein [Hydrogenophaga sp.]
MSNPYLFGAIGGFGNAFMKSFDATTEKNRQVANEDQERAWVDENRGRKRKEWALDDRVQDETNAGAAPGELEEFEETGAESTDEGPTPASTKKYRIKGTDQVFSDQASASAGLGKYNAPVQRQLRAADRVSGVDFRRGLGMRQEAVAALQNDSALDDATQKQIASVANRVLVESVPFSPNWGAAAAGHVNTIAGREIAKAVPTQDGNGFVLRVTGADGQTVNGGPYSNDEAGWTKYISTSMKRTPSELLGYIDATRQAQARLDAKRADEAAADQKWEDRQIFTDSLRDDRRNDGAGGSRSSKKNAAPAGSTSDPQVAAAAAADAVTEASKNADGAMKLGPDALLAARKNAEAVILANPGMSPNQAASVAIQITQTPDAVRPRLDKDSGRIDGVYTDPQSGSKARVYAFPQARLTDDDRLALRQDVREMRGEMAAADPTIASLIDKLAFGDQQAVTPLTNHLVRLNMDALRKQYKAAGREVPSDLDLNRVASAHVKNVAMPEVNNKAAAIRQFGEKPRQVRTKPASPASPSTQAAADNNPQASRMSSGGLQRVADPAPARQAAVTKVPQETAPAKSPQSMGDDFESPGAKRALQERIRASASGASPLTRIETLRARQLGFIQ